MPHAPPPPFLPLRLPLALWIIISEFLLILIAPNNWVLMPPPLPCPANLCEPSLNWAQLETNSTRLRFNSIRFELLTPPGRKRRPLSATVSWPTRCVYFCYKYFIPMPYILFTAASPNSHLALPLSSTGSGCLFASVLLFYCIVYAAESKLCFVRGIAQQSRNKTRSRRCSFCIYFC